MPDLLMVPTPTAVLTDRFMNTNNKRHEAHEYGCILTVQALIAPASKPQHRLMAIDRVDCVAIRNPVFLIIRRQTAISQFGWSHARYKITDNPRRHKTH